MMNDNEDGTTVDGWTAAEFIECANNGGEPIDWRNWVVNRPVLKAGDAARLMAGLEPTLHKSLEIARNESAGDAKQRARKFEEWAASQGMEHASPTDWLTWGQSQGEAVHVGFRLAVMELTKPESAPASQAEQWKQADAERKRELVMEALKLHGTQEKVAALFGVSRQRVAEVLPADMRKPRRKDDARVAPAFPISPWEPQKD